MYAEDEAGRPAVAARGEGRGAVGLLPVSSRALLASSGSEKIDEILRTLIAAFETTFPGRVRGYYLLGSYAEGNAVALSDVDLALIFKGELEEGEQDRAAQLGETCGQASPVRLDTLVRGEEGLTWETVGLKLGSVLLYGRSSSQ